MYVSLCDPQKCNHVKPTALRREEKIASIDIAQSWGWAGPSSHHCMQPALSLPALGRQTEPWAGPRHRRVRRGCPGLLKEGRSPHLEAGHSHTERQHTWCRRGARGAQTRRRRSWVKAVYCPVGVTEQRREGEEKERLSFKTT